MITLLPALALSATLAILAGLFGLVSLSGALVGCAGTVLILTQGGWPVFSALALLVIGGSIAGRAGGTRKRERGVEQEHGGRRDALHAAANVGPAVLCLIALPGADGRLAAMGALAAALADTVSGELGLLARAAPRALLFGPRVAPGTDGGMTWVGTGAGVGAALLAGVLVVLAGAPGGSWLPVALAGLFGTTLDSVLGLVLEPRLPRRAGNHVVNAISSLAAGLVAWGLMCGMGLAGGGR